MLESYLRKRLETKEILLMTHIVLGYPGFDECMRIIDAMVTAGVDLMELQIPFSEPIADGPVILHANQLALERGATVGRCLEFAGQAAARFDIPFLFMSYTNIFYAYGMDRMAAKMADCGIKGAILPDMPPEESETYLSAMAAHGLAPIYIFAPTTPEKRMHYLAEHGRGFIYCVARKGVTGADTQFSESLDHYLQRCRQATDLPLALGFGVKDKTDIDFLKGKVDIAVIGTQTLRLVDEQGIDAVGPFIKGLR